MNGFVKSCALALAACLLAGCAPSLPPQPTLDELLAEVNAEHQAIDNDGLKSEFIWRKPVDESGEPVSASEINSYFTDIADLESFDPNLVLTQEQMIEDVTYLFDAIYSCYGNYDRMGGRAAFDAAEQAILEECAQYSSLRAEEFQKLLVPHFAFVKDAHFQIQNQSPNSHRYSFFFREVAFYEDDGQYITADRKTVASVDGYADLSQLFKRSISPEGEIVYYPVLLKDSTTCDETLIVHYTNGSTQTLTAEPFQRYNERIEGDAVTEYHKDGEIPVFTIDSCYDGVMDEITAGAIMVARYPVGIVDIRANMGGSDSVSETWLRQYTYTNHQMFRNQFLMDVFSGSTGYEDGWVENDRVLIVLTSKNVASAAETFVDMAHNVENVLFIGENTWGAQVTSAAYHVWLPNSKCVVTMGHGLFVVPQDWDYYKELRGYEPDLWVPADEAEELAVKLMENLGAVQAEGEAASPAA